MPTPLEDECTVYDIADGDAIRLGAVLAKAGEGTIYAVEGRSDSVAKIFHPTLNGLEAKWEKINAMVASPPPGAALDDGFAVLAWPTHVLRKDDRPIGFTMPRIDTANAVEIHAVSNPFNRANPLTDKPQWPIRATWSHLVTVAANLCMAVDVVHHVDAVVGDFQERNILVSDTCRVTFVDCDSMQFTDSTGRVHLCAVGRPDFTAPELLGRDLATHVRSKESDLFALAIHIYLLLMAGNHPFQRGIWSGSGEQPGPMEMAKTGDWTGRPRSRLKTHPLAPPVTFLPNGIQRLFERAFTHGATEPQARPTAEEWRAALVGVQVVECARASHQIPNGAAVCPWCVIDDERTRRRAQPPVQPTNSITPSPTSRTQSPRPKQTSAQSPKAALVDRGDPATSYARKRKPPFKSTDYKKPAAVITSPPASSRRGSPAEAAGQNMFRVFLYIAIPFAAFMAITVVWIVVHIITQL